MCENTLQWKPTAERETLVSLWRVCGLPEKVSTVSDILPAGAKAQTTDLKVAIATPGPAALSGLLPPHPRCSNPSVNNLIM